MRTKPITVTVELPNGEEEERTLPTRWAICPHCDGEGASSRYLGAITQSDREPGGAWDDPEEFADYMAGHYDRKCDTCDGTGKVREVDVERCKPEELTAWEDHCKMERELRAIERAERRMGC